MTSGEGILSSTGFPTPLLITPSGKAAPRRPDPGIRRRIQIGTLRPIRVDHTKCLQVAIKAHSFKKKKFVPTLFYCLSLRLILNILFLLFIMKRYCIRLLL